VSERGQVSVMACALVLLLVLAGFLIGILGGIDSAGANAQRAADMAALAAGTELSDHPAVTAADLRAAADGAAHDNGGRVVSLTRLTEDGLPSGVEVSVVVDGQRPVQARARVRVEFTAAEPTGSFRPVDLHGLAGRAAVVAAAGAQVGWPYVWGGESRAEGGFDCSGLVDYAFTAAGASLPGRPTAADLWRMGRPVPAAALQPGDLVFVGTAGGAPHHVGIYVGDGTVLSAPHTGARVGYSPLASGGWDGYASLLPAGPAPVDDPVSAAARRSGVPGHVLAAELRMGLASDPDAAAAALARAQLAHPDSLAEALAAQLGSVSAAALVLRDGGGAGVGLSAAVRLVPVPHGDVEVEADGQPLPAPAPVQTPGGRPAAGAAAGSSWSDNLGTALDAGGHTAEQLGERGRAVPLQAAAALQHLSRFGLTALGGLLPDPDWRDAVNLVGSVWDTYSAVRDLTAAAAAGGLELSGVGLWAARFSVLGGALSTGLFAAQAYSARRSNDRVGYGLMAVGSAATTAGLMTAGGSLMAMGATTSVVPPVGLTLIAVGAVICVTGYLVRHPGWCRSAARVGATALDVAWRAQTAPVRAVASVASGVAGRVRSLAGSIPTPW
jgi:cell wall-associated NlpC family hydrolase